jgi:outer membrane protein TolC
MKQISLALMLTAALTQAGASTAAEAPQQAPDPLLASLIAEAVSKNPDVIAVQEALTAAQARPVQARSLANPMASVVYTNDGWSPSLGTKDMTTLAFMGSQDLPFPGKLRLKGEIRTVEAGQFGQQVERTKLSLTAAVKRAYYGLLLARDRLDLIREQEEFWRQIESVARARYSVGQGAQQDVLRVQIEVTRIEQLRAEQAAEAEIRVAEINRLLSRPATSPLETPGRLGLRPLEGDLESLVKWVSEISPELKNARLSTEKGSLGVSLAQKEFKPDFNLQAAYMNRGGLDPMLLAGVGISLPIYRSRLQGALAEAQAQLRSSQNLVQSVELQLRFRTQERVTQIKTTERISRLYSQGIVPQDRMSVDAAIANYQTGKVPFIAVLEALTTLYNDRGTLLTLLANHEKIRASLEEASLEETSGMAASGMAAVGGSALNMAGGGAPAGSSDSMGGR